MISDISSIHKSNIHHNVKVISINCCSLCSTDRRARFCGLLDEHKSDIIVGCESHLDESYLSSEIFPQGLIYTEKIGKLVEEVYSWELRIHWLLSVEEPTITTTAEMVWVKINLYSTFIFAHFIVHHNHQSLNLGSQ